MSVMSFNSMKKRTETPKKEAPKQEVEKEEVVDAEVVYDASADDEDEEEETPEQIKPKTRKPKAKKVAKKAPEPEEESDEPEPEPTPKPATQPPAKVAPKAELAAHLDPIGDLVGFDAEDVSLPRLALVQKTSEIASEYEIGTFVLNKEIPLTEKAEDSFQLIALTARKFFEEDTNFDDEDAEQRRFDTKEEVKEAGGHFNYDKKDDGGYFYKAADILCLVALPDGFEEYEEYNFQGMSFARCMFTVRKSTYQLARSLATSKAAGHLKGRPMCDAMWDIGSITRKEGKRDWKTITVKSHRPIDKDLSFSKDEDLRTEFLDFVRNIQQELL